MEDLADDYFQQELVQNFLLSFVFLATNSLPEHELVRIRLRIMNNEATYTVVAVVVVLEIARSIFSCLDLLFFSMFSTIFCYIVYRCSSYLRLSVFYYSMGISLANFIIEMCFARCYDG